jgi:hypothetical protein
MELWHMRLERWSWLALLLLAEGCRGGGARGAAARLPMPEEPAQWVALAVFVFGLWWVAMKIMRG